MPIEEVAVVVPALSPLVTRVGPLPVPPSTFPESVPTDELVTVEPVVAPALPGFTTRVGPLPAPLSTPPGNVPTDEIMTGAVAVGLVFP